MTGNPPLSDANKNNKISFGKNPVVNSELQSYRDENNRLICVKFQTEAFSSRFSFTCVCMCEIFLSPSLKALVAIFGKLITFTIVEKGSLINILAPEKELLQNVFQIKNFLEKEM